MTDSTEAAADVAAMSPMERLRYWFPRTMTDDALTQAIRAELEAAYQRGREDEKDARTLDAIEESWHTQ